MILFIVRAIVIPGSCTGLSMMNVIVLGEAGEGQAFLCLYYELQAHKAE